MITNRVQQLLILLLLLAMWLLGGLPRPAASSLASHSTDVGRTPPSLSEPYLYTDGMQVSVERLWVGEYHGTPVIEFTVVVHNGTSHTVETRLQGDLLEGPYRRSAIRQLGPLGPDDAGSSQLVATGETSDPYALRFVKPHDTRNLVFQLSIDAGAHDPAVFVGGV